MEEHRYMYVYTYRAHLKVNAIYQIQEVSVFIVMPFNKNHHIRISKTKKEAKISETEKIVGKNYRHGQEGIT